MGARTIHPFPARMAPDIAIDHLGSTADEELVVLDRCAGLELFSLPRPPEAIPRAGSMSTPWRSS